MAEPFEFGNPEIVEEEIDILLIGGGMACCGAAFEIMRWAEGTGLKIKLVDKAAMDRSGAVAQGLSAINTYMGENDPSDYVRYVRNDLMGIIREDLVYDVGRHVDDSVHNFEDWGLPIWKQPGDEDKTLAEGGKPVRSGRWQIMINGESYKWIVAEAAKKALGMQNIQERVFIVRLVTDKNDPTRVAGAAGFSVRDHKLYIYKFKCCLLAAGGAVNVFRPRSVGEGVGRAWYPVWNAGSTYAMAAECGAEMTMMENRFVPARFKDGYGPVGAWFLLFKAKVVNGMGEDYNAMHGDMIKDEKRFGKYGQGVPGTCLRNHIMINEMKEGRGPIHDGHAGGARQTRRENDAEGNQAPRSRGVGRLPRHDDFAGRHLGGRKHRARQAAVRNHADRALPARLACRLRRHLGFRSDRYSGHAQGMAMGLQPHDDGERVIHRRRRCRRLGSQVFLRFACRRPHRRQGDGQVRARQQGLET